MTVNDFTLIKLGASRTTPVRHNPKKASQELRWGILETLYPEGMSLLTELARELKSRDEDMRALEGGTRLEFPLDGDMRCIQLAGLLGIPGDLEICEQKLDVRISCKGRSVRLGITDKDL